MSRDALVAATRPPSVLPRLVAAVAAGAVALVAPLYLAAAVGAAALSVVAHCATPIERRGTAWAASGLAAGSLALTPLWLHFLAAVPLRAAFDVSFALAVRLVAVLLVGAALSLALRPRSWLASLRRFPRLALALSLTFRQVPELAADVERVRLAQHARGLHLGWGAWRPRAVALPLVQRALRRADRMGEALTLAGWGSRARNPLVRPARTRADVAWLGVAAVATAVSLFFGLVK